jgi:hypothetical protein
VRQVSSRTAPNHARQVGRQADSSSRNAPNYARQG